MRYEINNDDHKIFNKKINYILTMYLKIRFIFIAYFVILSNCQSCFFEKQPYIFGG